jgi:hypothetical protein
MNLGAQPQPYYNPGAMQGNQPPQGWQPPVGGPPQQNWGAYNQQQPSAQYGGAYGQPASGSAALSNGTFFSGLVAFIILAGLFVFYFMVRSGSIFSLGFSAVMMIARIVQILSWVMVLAGVVSLVLGILALVNSGKNRALSVPKTIIGMVLGGIPLLLFIIGLANIRR